MSLRRPVWALYVLIVGLALHNLVMVAALARGRARRRAVGDRRRGRTSCCWSRSGSSSGAAAACRSTGRTSSTGSRSHSARSSSSTRVLPQSWLGGGATHKGVLYAARHDLLPVEAYFLGRGARPDVARSAARLPRASSPRPRASRPFGLRRRLSRPALVVAPLGRPGGSGISSACTYQGPERPARELRLQRGRRRRLPAARPRRSSRRSRPRTCSSSRCSSCRCADGAGAGRSPLLLFAALLWTHTRAALLALVLALLVLAVLRRAAVLRRPGRRGGGDRLRVRAGVRPHRPAHAFHDERARVPGATRARDAGQEQRRDERERGVDAASTCRASAPARAPRCTTRGDSASATPA